MVAGDRHVVILNLSGERGRGWTAWPGPFGSAPTVAREHEVAWPARSVAGPPSRGSITERARRVGHRQRAQDGKARSSMGTSHRQGCHRHRGGGGGIGGASARALARRGRRGRRGRCRRGGGASAFCRGASLRAGGDAVALRADLSEEAEVAAAVAFTALPSVASMCSTTMRPSTDSDFLTRDTAVPDLSLDVWERTMAVNLRSQMLTCKHVVPEMARGGGQSSSTCRRGTLGGPYPDRLWGLEGGGEPTHHVRGDLATGKQGIRVNTILPGLVTTDAVRGAP